MNPPPPIHVVFALLPGSLVLDWAGPAEALRLANAVVQAQGQPPRFVLRFASPAPQADTSAGIALAGLEPLPATLPEPAWVVLVGQPGAALDVATPAARALLHWLRGLRLHAGRCELVSVCAGAVLAAHAGLLAGRQATTHHHHLHELATADATCSVVANRVFVSDGPAHTSAGMTCGIDLTLHRIGQLCGPAVAAQVAHTMALPLRRGPHDPELSPFLQHRNHLHAALHRVQDAVGQAPRADWSVAAMAAHAGLSARHLSRLFQTYAGIAPLAWLRHIRLAAADAALQAGYNVTQAAEQAGFNSDTQLRRAWRQSGRAGAPSQRYRRRQGASERVDR